MSENVNRLATPFQQFWNNSLQGIYKGHLHMHISNRFINDESSFQIFEEDLPDLYSYVSGVINRVEMEIPSLFDMTRTVDFSENTYFSFYYSDQKTLE